MKKIVSVALASAMLLSGLAVFAGCGEVYKTDIDWDKDLSKPIPLKGLYPETGMGAFGKDDTAKIIEKTTGYTVEYQELGSNADNDINNYLTTRESYHFMKLTEAQYHPYLEGGTFCDLTDLLQKTESGRILYQLIDLMDYGWDSVTYVDEAGVSHIYGVPDFGYVSMTDAALVWNRNHLDQIGFTEKYPDTENGLPETMEQVTWALMECQKLFGSDSSYHALGIPGGNSCEITAFKGAFEVPFQFYVDDDGKIQQYVFSENTMNYSVYMNKLFHSNEDGINFEDASGNSLGNTAGYGTILSSAWQGESASSMNLKFANEKHSCVFTVYWNMIPIYDSIRKTGQIAEKMGIENTNLSIKQKALGWQLRVRGDGSEKSVKQEVARIEGGDAGVSYYTVIPAYMQDTALYTIDFLAKKMLYFADFYGGNEGTGEPLNPDDRNDPNYDTHWYEIEAPAGAPKAEEYDDLLAQTMASDPTLTETEARNIVDNIYYEYEDLTGVENVAKGSNDYAIFLSPYSFTYTRYYNDESVKSNILDEETMHTEEITVSRPGKWVNLTKRYGDHIVNNSQYCNGTNAVSARILFHLRETGFDSWRVTIPTDDTLIGNPMAMCPPMEHWAPISILSRTLLKDGIKKAINAADPVSSLTLTRQSALTQNKKIDGVKYYYWSDEISDEMTKWYNDVKLNRK